MEWHENFENAKGRALEEIDVIHYEIYQVKDISLIEETSKD